MIAEELARTLTIQYRYTTWTFGQSVEGISDKEARINPGASGNCMTWVAGHILDSRAGTLKVMGADVPVAADKYGRFGRGSAPLIADEAVPDLSEIVTDFEATIGPLQKGLLGLTDELLAQAAPFSPGDNPKETVGSLLAGLLFHESYHVGQLGILRRLLGAASVIK